MSDELLLFEDKPSDTKSEFKPHEWGHWQDESTIPVSDGVEWRTNGFGGHDLVVDDDVTLGYVKRVTYEVREGWRRGFVQEKDEVDHYVALVESVQPHYQYLEDQGYSNIEDLGKCKTSREARQRILDYLTEKQHGWDESVPF